jgi:hypothetical protein
MEQNQIEEIMECLPRGRTKFYYFKDRYALMLLSYFIGKGLTVHQIKNSRYKRLIDKPIVQKIIQNNGCKILTTKELGSFWPDFYHCYLLTLNKWGGQRSWSRFHNQTSRPGWNLVLQLNFSSQHNNSYNHLIKPGDLHPFQSHGHPIAKDGHHTLAWARIDMDLDNNEALIEEIQTDWIRLAIKSEKLFSANENCIDPRRRYQPRYIKGLGCDLKSLSMYLENELKSHIRVWEEAMLSSAIWFLRDEIGINNIFYHTFDFGCRLKRISGSKPPRSLYTKLPERFCFQKTNQGPTFLMQKNNRTMTNLIKNQVLQFYSLVI